MNRKGKLTTKGKHAVILTLTIVACVAAMLFSLLLSVLCDGKHVSSAAHTPNDTHPGIMAGSQRQETDLLTPQWLYYQSNGSVTDCNIKKEMDQGKARGKGIGQADKRIFAKKGLSGQANYYAGESGVCISVGKGTSGLYKNTCKKREDISVYRGIYRGTAG